MKKLLEKVVFFVLLTLTVLLCSCAKNPIDFIATNIIANDITLAGLTRHELVFELEDQYGNRQDANHSDFWFNAKYVYIMERLVVVKESAPEEFTDEITIEHKSNSVLKAKISVEKVRVVLQSLTLMTDNGKKRWAPNRAVQLITTFTPSNTTERDVSYEIVSGREYANIDSEGGILSIRGDAQSGKEVGIVVKRGAIISPVYTITIAMPIVTQGLLISDGYDLVTSYESVYSDFYTFDEIDLNELHKLGYKDIEFSFGIESIKKAEYSDVYLEAQKKNGGIWNIYTGEFSVGSEGWDYYTEGEYNDQSYGSLTGSTYMKNITITEFLLLCGPTPMIRMVCGSRGASGSNGYGRSRWVRGHAGITIMIS
ncbi:MAG: hypothetical protein LBU04_00205 [Christensenellaceae bacterium]|nr:hypothetical protein [Christensenellaceae bacterium]